jgi:hypothetical protein
MSEGAITAHSCPRAAMPKSGDLALQAIAGGTGLVAEQQLAVPAGQLVDQAPDRLRGVVDLAEEADLTLAALFGHGHGDLQLGDGIFGPLRSPPLVDGGGASGRYYNESG